MDTLVDKQVQMANYRAKQLEQLATTRGIPESILIEEALDMLFRESKRAETLRADWEQLQQLEAELGPVLPPSAQPIRPEETVYIVGTPMPSAWTKLC